jgi:carbonic anhydrase
VSHTCRAIIVSCMDFRFQTFIRDWAVKNIGERNYDLVSWAGASKDIDNVLKMIELSVKLHATKEVYLVHHEDCGAYGPTGTKEIHCGDLKVNKAKILAKLPELKVKTLYLTINGSFKETE